MPRRLASRVSDWPSFERIVSTLRTLEDDETLLVQSGKPAGVLRTHPDAPRVLYVVPTFGSINMIGGECDR